MELRKIAAATLTVLAAGLSVCPAANAALVLVGPQVFQGTGLGAVNTILTIQSPGNTTDETGSVGRSLGNINDVVIGDVKTGASQTQTRTISTLGVTSAADLRVVFNPLEPGNGDNGILLSNLMLSIFSPTGALLFDSGVFASVNFVNTDLGAGKSGFVFRLDDAQASAAQLAAFGIDFGNNRVGLSATANNATGGFETFFVINQLPGGGGGGGGGGPGGTPLPEPATLGLVGLALFGVIGARRRKQ